MAGDRKTILIANPGADLYGSDRMAIESARALINAGYNVIVTVPGPGPLVQRMTDLGALVVELPVPVIRRGLLSPRGLLQLTRETVSSWMPMRRLLRRTGAGTVLVNTVTLPSWFAVSRLAGRQVVCHVHEAEAMASRILRAALYLPLLFCQRLVVNSQVTLEVLRAVAPMAGSRATVVHNAVAGPPEVTRPRDRPAVPPRVLYVGRLSYRKGPHLVVEAARLLRERGQRVAVDLVGAVFAGNEEYESRLRDQVATAGLADDIRFLGFQPSVWRFIGEADVVVMPSVLDESFGNAAVEAALGARPLIVSEIPGILEATSSVTSRVVVPTDDAVAVADAIQRILDEWTDFAAKAGSTRRRSPSDSRIDSTAKD